jgi:hypothetical protein
MKDIAISSDRIKKELIQFSVIFLLSNIANLIAIIYYKTSFVELFTSIHYVLIFTISVYAVWTVIRIIYNLVIKAAVKIKQRKNKNAEKLK